MQVNDRRAGLRGPIAASAISCAVIGRWGDIEGVWIAPVTAQVMMTLAIPSPFRPPGYAARPTAATSIPKSVAALVETMRVIASSS